MHILGHPNAVSNMSVESLSLNSAKRCEAEEWRKGAVFGCLCNYIFDKKYCLHTRTKWVKISFSEISSKGLIISSYFSTYSKFLLKYVT